MASGHSVANTEDLPDGFQMTELGPLPKEWRVVRLGEVVKLTKGRKPDESIPKYQFGALPYLTADYFRNRLPTEWVPAQYLSKLPLCSKEDVVLIWDGSKAGQVFIGLEGVLASTMVRIDPEKQIERHYLYYFLLTQFDLLNSKTTGTTIPHVNKEVFHNLPIPLPPLPEQRAIAHVLRTVQRAKEATEGVIAALKELKKSLMQHLFTYGPIPVTEREQVELQESEIGPLPSHWRVVRLGEVAKLRTGPFGSLLHASDYVEGGIPFVMPKDLSSTGQIIPHSIARIKQDDRNRLKNYLLQVGDIILGRRGEIGRRALVTKKEEGWVCGSGCLRIRPNDKLYPLYLSYLFEIEVVRCYLSSEAIGTTMANLNTQILSRLPIPLPPLDEQREIARMLQAVDTRIAAEQARRAALEELFKSLLHALMSGRIRVPNIVGGERSCDSAPDADPLPESED